MECCQKLYHVLPDNLVLPKLFIARHLLSVKIDKVWQSYRYQSSLLFGQLGRHFLTGLNKSEKHPSLINPET